MATYPLNQVIRGSLQFTLSSGQAAFIVLHFARTGAGPATSVDVQQVASNLNNLATATYSTFQFTNGLAAEIAIPFAHSRTVDPLNPIADDIAIGVNGNIPGEPVPFESAYVVTHYSALANRRGRGRSFVPGVASNQVVNGLLQAEFVDAHQAVWDGWRTEVAGTGTLEFVVWSPTNQTAQTVTASLVRPVMHHQSSRNP